mgnify:CR=1 FL=1
MSEMNFSFQARTAIEMRKVTGYYPFKQTRLYNIIMRPMGLLFDTLIELLTQLFDTQFQKALFDY